MIGRVSKMSVGRLRLTHGGLRPHLRRFWSWQDLNPLAYMSGAYQSARGYWYGNTNQNTSGGSGNGKTEGTNTIELSTVADPIPVFLDLSSVKQEDEEEETFSKIQNFGKVSLLLLLRFRKHFLNVLGKYIKVLFEDNYEYMLLVLMFFLL